MKNALFITSTDTGAGKTIITASIALYLKKKGVDVGVMKPFQCSGGDSEFLIRALGIKDDQELVNPCYAQEPLAPYAAFKREGREVELKKVFLAFEELTKRHEFLIVEGIGGLMVPLKKDYLLADFIRDLDSAVIIVAKPGLGSLNHTLLTQSRALDYGLRLKGVIINGYKGKDLAQKTNPGVLADYLSEFLLSVVPFVPNAGSKNGLDKIGQRLGKDIDLRQLFKEEETKTEKLVKLDKKYTWHPFTQMQDWLKDQPLVIEEGKGSYLKDTRGKWYLDGVSSLWANVHGHRKKEIDAAIKRQLNKLGHSTFLGLSNEPAILLAEQLVKLAPGALKKVFYSDNGSSAVEVALKMGYQYWHNLGVNKTKFIHLENSYHGDTLGSVSVGGIDLFHKAYKGLLFKTYKVNSPYCYRCPKGKKPSRCSFVCLDELRETLNKHHREICGLIVEPTVQAAAGMLVWPKGVYQKMAGLCRKYNVLLIADEVAVGFGRTGRMFASSLERVSPDILCLAKGISAGYLPLAATLTTQKIFDAFLGEYKEQKTFFHGHTYTANPLGCAAALANLEIFKKERTLERLVPKVKFLKRGLKKFNTLEHVGDIRQKGMMIGIELVKDKKAKEPYAWEEKIGIQVCRKARDYGVILRPLGNVIVLMPALTISQGELGLLLEAAYKAIEDVTQPLLSDGFVEKKGRVG